MENQLGHLGHRTGKEPEEHDSPRMGLEVTGITEQEPERNIQEDIEQHLRQQSAVAMERPFPRPEQTQGITCVSGRFPEQREENIDTQVDDEQDDPKRADGFLPDAYFRRDDEQHHQDDKRYGDVGDDMCFHIPTTAYPENQIGGKENTTFFIACLLPLRHIHEYR